LSKTNLQVIKMLNITNVLAPTDFSERCGVALDHAINIAKSVGAKLHIVHVMLNYVAPIGLEYAQDAFVTVEKELMESSRIKLRELETKLSEQGIDYHTELLIGKPSDEIVKYADRVGIDLIVIATHGASGLEHFLFGSTTEKVLRKANCPIYVVKQK